jgi:hypothetical protein
MASIGIDGSRQMKIGGNKGVFNITFKDPGKLKALIPVRAGRPSDGVLHTDIDFRCLGGVKKQALDVDYEFRYHEAGDTLTDAWGVTWHRTRKNKNK